MPYAPELDLHASGAGLVCCGAAIATEDDLPGVSFGNELAVFFRDVAHSLCTARYRTVSSGFRRCQVAV
jgi:hypothetical protein